MTVGILAGAAADVFPHLSCPAKIMFHTLTHSCCALIDSSSEQNFPDKALAHKLGLPSVPLPEVLKVPALNGGHLASVTHCTQEITLILPGNHSEKISFLLFKAPNTPLVLGFPWLQLHNPQINWVKRCVTGWSTRCLDLCLHAAVPDSPNTGPVKSKPPPDLTLVPTEYYDLGQVFRKDQALSLPPHRPYDSGIDLLLRAPLPTSQLFSLSKPECDTMERYVTDSLAAGIIRPSSSPLEAGFFFVEKKNKTLCPCIDFRGLNK